jgi:probable rRNA maturation factor
MKDLIVTVQYASGDATGLPTRANFRRWARAALFMPMPGEVTIRLVDVDESRRLNHNYRGKDTPTNVLSFPYGTTPVLSGDLALCPAVVVREATKQKKPLTAHYAHLTVHGLLHLQGYDHENEVDAQKMEAREREILASLGYPDPYLTPSDMS